MEVDLSQKSHEELMEMVAVFFKHGFVPPEPKTPADKQRLLPFIPRGLSRTEAALYVGVGPTLFDEMVKDKRMPRPKMINSRRVWDRVEVDAHFAALPADEEKNPWDEVFR